MSSAIDEIWASVSQTARARHYGYHNTCNGPRGNCKPRPCRKPRRSARKKCAKKPVDRATTPWRYDNAKVGRNSLTSCSQCKDESCRIAGKYVRFGTYSFQRNDSQCYHHFVEASTDQQKEQFHIIPCGNGRYTIKYQDDDCGTGAVIWTKSAKCLYKPAHRAQGHNVLGGNYFMIRVPSGNGNSQVQEERWSHQRPPRFLMNTDGTTSTQPGAVTDTHRNGIFDLSGPDESLDAINFKLLVDEGILLVADSRRPIWYGNPVVAGNVNVTFSDGGAAFVATNPNAPAAGTGRGNNEDEFAAYYKEA